MNIPETIKIGGRTYKVNKTQNLYSGRACVSAEILFNDLVINISENPKDKMESDLLHESLHAVYDFMGIHEQDEESIDRLANALYMVIKDNPDVFEEKAPVKDYAVGVCKYEVTKTEVSNGDLYLYFQNQCDRHQRCICLENERSIEETLSLAGFEYCNGCGGKVEVAKLSETIKREIEEYRLKTKRNEK